MDNHSDLLKKESADFAAETEKPNVRANRSSSIPTLPIATKQPEMDELLEDTLRNSKLDNPLTERETEILKLIVAGRTNKKIAKEIYRTERTVEYHRHRLMRKLKANTAADLIKRAITAGLV